MDRDAAAGDQPLNIVGHYDRAPSAPAGPLPPVSASGFPPPAILDAARAEPGSLTFVVPVRVGSRGRFGGDEFLVLLDALDDEHTPVTMGERLQARSTGRTGWPEGIFRSPRASASR